MPKQGWILTEADTRLLLDHAVAAAARMGLSISVAVVEAGGHMIGLLRMDGAKLASIDAAIGKGWTAALFRRAAGDYAAPTAPGGVSWGMLNAFPGRMLPSPGGQPIIHEGECIGGVGVSGASAAEDDAIAIESVAALRQKPR